MNNPPFASPLGFVSLRRHRSLVAVFAATLAFLTGCGSQLSSGSGTGTSQSQKTLKSLAISPATASFQAGGTQQFTATATYSDGSSANVTSVVTWAMANTKIATISAAGLATGAAAGSTSVTATDGSVSGSAQVTVTAASTPSLTAITLAPATASISVGGTQQFTATAKYSDGSTADITSKATWVTANTSVASVNAGGLVTGAAAGTTTVTASMNGFSGTSSVTVASSTATLASLAVTPASASVNTGATQQFTATATYSDGSTADVTSKATWSSSDSSIATVNSSGLASGVAAGSANITASLNGVSSNQAALTVTAPPPGVNITTWHVDNNRTGLNSQETVLTPSNVNPSSFGKLFSYLVDGYVYGEPLIVSNLTIDGARHNVLFVATEKDTVYAFDADNYGNGQPLWKTSLLQPGETPLTDAAIQPYEGVTSTPVIDPKTNTLYVVSEQTTAAGPGTYRLSALDLTTGAQKFGGPVTIQASVPGTNPAAGNGTTVTLTTSCIQRSALLLANGNVYFGIGDCPTGWLLAYNASTLAQVAVWNASPNIAGEGTYASAGGIWMGGGGPVADSSGNVYVVTGNGPWDGNTAWGDSVIKFSPDLKIEDYFTPDDYAFRNCDDTDLAAGGLLLIPGTSDLVAGGKTGKVFLLNSGDLGHEQANNAGAIQSQWFESDLVSPYTSAPCTDSSGSYTDTINPYEIFGTSAYYNGYVYLGIAPTKSGTPAPVRQFQFNGKTLTPGAYTGENALLNSRGITPFISSDGTQHGIVWMLDQGVPLQENSPSHATLRAFSAAEFPSEIYNSNQNSADVPGYGIKFTSPVVANGKVYISTGHDLSSASNPQGEIDVYGLK